MHDKYSNHGICVFNIRVDARGLQKHVAEAFRIAVDTYNFRLNGPNEDNIKIIHEEYNLRNENITQFFPLIVSEDLNSIHAKILNNFIFIDDSDLIELELARCATDFPGIDSQYLKEEDLFNVSNMLEPLKVYRLKRTLSTTFSDESNNNTEKKVSKTYWDVEILNHSKDIPCSRKNHCATVNSSANCLYLFGGVTILVEVDSKHKMRDPKFWQKRQLCDVWKLNLLTNTWRKILDFRPDWQTQSPTSIPLPFALFHLRAVCDLERNLIYGCFQELTLKNDTEIINNLIVICIDPISKRIEEHRCKSSGKPSIAFYRPRDSLGIYSKSGGRESFRLIEKKRLDAKTRSTGQLLTPYVYTRSRRGPLKKLRIFYGARRYL